MESLDLKYNDLSGPLPDTLGALRSLVAIDLRHSGLSGPVPLTYLDLDLRRGYFGDAVCVPDDDRFAGWIWPMRLYTDLDWPDDVCVNDLTVRNSDTYGGAGPVLAGVAVTLSNDGGTVDSGTTAADGKITFDDPDADYSGPLRVGLALDSLRRTYADVRLGGLPDTTLVLPGRLHDLLRREFTKLDTTSARVLGYNTGSARALVGSWNTGAPLSVEDHQARDAALARLFVASEALRELYDLSGPLASETTQSAVQSVLSVLAMRRAFAAVAKSFAGDALALELVGRAVAELLDSIGEEALEGLKSRLSPWAADALDAVQDNTSRWFGAAAVTDDWSTPSLRRGILESVSASAAERVGPPVIGSAYVLLTRDDLDEAVDRSEALAGAGTVEASDLATQDRLAELTVRVDDFVAASEGVRVTTTHRMWSVLSDGSLIAGRIYVPLAVLGAVIKGGEISTSVGLTGYGFVALGRLALKDAPEVVDLSFDPAAARIGPPAAVGAAGPGSKASGPAAAATPKTDGFEAYLSSLDALKVEVERDDEGGARAAARGVLDEDDGLRDAVESRGLALEAVADAARSVAGLPEALEAVQRAQAVLAVERSLFLAAAAEYFAPGPEGGPPHQTVADSLTVVGGRVASAIEAWAAAVAEAEAARGDLRSRAYVAVTDHGVDLPLGVTDVPASVPVTITATVRNAGDEGADVVVELVDVSDGAPVVGVGEPTRNVGPLGPGEARELSWTVVPRDTSALGVSVATYRVSVSPSSGRARGASGSFDVTSDGAVRAEPGPKVELALAVWPNPSSGPVRVSLTTPVAAMVRLDVYDALGRRVAVVQESAYPVGQSVVDLETSGLAPGAYVVRAAVGGEPVTARFSVVR